MKDTLELLEIMQAQLVTCDRFLNIQTDKTDALVNGDIKKLDDIVRAEQSFVMQMESFESKRANILEKLGFSKFTIRYVIENCVEDVLKERYQGVLDSSVDVLDRIKKAAALNQRLLKQRLMVVNSILGNTSKGSAVLALDEREHKSSNPEFSKEKIKRA